MGGYSLAVSPGKITVKDIVEVLQGGLDFVENIKNKSFNSKTSLCIKSLVWKRLYNNVSTTLDSITLEDLSNQCMRSERMSFTYSI